MNCNQRTWQWQTWLHSLYISVPIPVDLHIFLLSLVFQSFCAAPTHQGAAPTATPSRGPSNHTATPFYSAVADVKSRRIDDPTSTPASCRLFGDVTEVYQTPPSSPSKELFKTSPVNSDWNRNPLYANTLTNSTPDTSLSYTLFNKTTVDAPSASKTTWDTPVNHSSNKALVDTDVSKTPLHSYVSRTPQDTDVSKTPLTKTPLDRRVNMTPLDMLLIDTCTSTPTVDSPVTCVDTRALDDILQDIEWSTPDTARWSAPKNGHAVPPRSSSFRHKMSDPSPMLQQNIGRLNEKHRHRHSITTCTQDEISARVDSDWISADAPDNTLIKPSKLRGSFRSRRGRSSDKENVPSMPDNKSQQTGQVPAHPQPSKKTIELKDTVTSQSRKIVPAAVKSHDTSCVNGQSKHMASPIFEPHETVCISSQPVDKIKPHSIHHRASDVSLGSVASFKEDQEHRSPHGLPREGRHGLSTQTVMLESSVPQKLWLTGLNRKPSLESSDDELRVSYFSLLVLSLSLNYL